MIIYFDNGGFVLSETELICYTVKEENGVTEQFSLSNVSSLSSIVEMQLVYKIVRLDFTSYNAA